MKAKFELSKNSGDARVSLCEYRALRNLPHWHMEHELVFVRRGSGTLRIDNRSYNLSCKTVAIIPSECIHDIVCDADCEVAVLKFGYSDSEDIFSIAVPNNYAITDTQLTDSVDICLHRIESELHNRPMLYERSIFCLIETMLINICRQVSITPPQKVAGSKEQSQKLLSAIEKDFASMTFDKAAKLMGYSRAYFSEYFKDMCGMTFTEYLNLIKVGEAVKMLKQEKRTVTEAAYLCGFGCIRSFNRVFKKLTGYAPTSLPNDYSFISKSHAVKETGFDPTLPPTVLLKDMR